MAKGWRGISAPLFSTEIYHGLAKGAKGAESKEDGGVGRGVVNSGRDIRDADPVVGACWYVNLVVAGS